MEAPFHWCVVLERIQTHAREQVEFCCSADCGTGSNESLISKQQIERQATAAIFKEMVYPNVSLPLTLLPYH